jgi:hypothetical protein
MKNLLIRVFDELVALKYLSTTAKIMASTVVMTIVVVILVAAQGNTNSTTNSTQIPVDENGIMRAQHMVLVLAHTRIGDSNGLVFALTMDDCNMLLTGRTPNGQFYQVQWGELGQQYTGYVHWDRVMRDEHYINVKYSRIMHYRHPQQGWYRGPFDK